MCYHPYFLYLDDFLLEKETQKVNVKFRRKNIDESCYKLQQIYRKIPCTLFCWFYNSTKEILAVYIFFLADIGEKEKNPIHLHKYNKIILEVALHKMVRKLLFSSRLLPKKLFRKGTISFI